MQRLVLTLVAGAGGAGTVLGLLVFAGSRQTNSAIHEIEAILLMGFGLLLLAVGAGLGAILDKLSGDPKAEPEASHTQAPAAPASEAPAATVPNTLGEALQQYRNRR